MNDSDLSIFKAILKGDVVTANDAGYLLAIARWAINSQRRAKVVAFVKDASDVALAIKFARDQGFPIAIRGGGHNFAGASSSEDGLVIDLSRYINTARVDPVKHLVYVGGGALWGTVDKAAIHHGLATVAGTVNHTGVGGLTLGGGFGWLSSAHGMVVDNLVEAKVVIADGSVLTANDTENEDLFFAIRGGGSNFGVVTEFVLRLYPQRTTVYSGMLVYPLDVLENLIETTTTWWATAGEREGMMQIISVDPDGKPNIATFLFYNGSELEGKENFKAFIDLGPVLDTTKEGPFEDVNTLLNSMMHHGQGVYLKAVAQYEPHYPTIAATFDQLVDCANSEFKMNVLYEYLPHWKINSIPRERTAFRRDPMPTVLVMAIWKEDVEGIVDRARAATYDLVQVVTGGRSELSLGYSNHDAEGVTGEKEAVPDKARKVFAENYPRLQAIKKRYDPKNVFNKWFPIIPA